LTLTISANTRIVSFIGKFSIAFSSGNINNVWPSLKEYYIGQGITVNDANHSVSATLNQSDPMAENGESDFQINKNGTKIRASASEFGNNFPDYLIMAKQ